VQISRSLPRIRPPRVSVSRVALIGFSAFALIFIAFIFGVMSALYPPSFVIKVGMLVGLGVVFLLAVLVRDQGSTRPITVMSVLLYLLIFLLAVWPPYLSFQGLPGPSINPTRLVSWALSALLFFWIVASPRMRAQLWKRISAFPGFFWMLGGYFVWAFVCSLAGDYPVPSIYHLIKQALGPLVAIFAVLMCFRDKRDVERAFVVMLAAAGLAVLVGLVEYARKGNIFWDYLPSLFPQGDEAAQYTETLLKDKSRSGAYRVTSTFSHPLTFGEYLALCIPVAGYLALEAKARLLRLAAWMAFPFLIAGIYLAHTRSPLIAAGITAGCMGLYMAIRAMRQKRSLFLSLVGIMSIAVIVSAGVVAAGYAIDLVIGRDAAERGSSMARLIMLERGGEMLALSPLLGYGAGQAAFAIGFIPGVSVLTIDNYYLSVALESGVPGILLFIGFLAYACLLAFKLSFKGDPSSRLMSFAIFAAMLAFCVVKSALSLTQNMDIFFMLMGFAMVLTLDKGESEPSEKVQNGVK
jgi:hypothetical protein